MRTIYFNIFCICIFIMLAGCVETQEFTRLENRVRALEMDNSRFLGKEENYDSALDVNLPEILNRLDSLEKSQKVKYAEVNVMMSSIKQEMLMLKGAIEESEYRLSRHGITPSAGKDSDYTRLDNAISQNYQRLARIEEYLGFEPSGSLHGAASGAISSQDNTGGVKPNNAAGEEAMYNSAKDMLDRGNNEQARALFESFLEKYPDSDNADNARFWIADSYYRDKWYEKAILEYQKVVVDYAGGNKVPAAMLKQGYAFSNLGEDANAKLILKELVKKFPGTREADIAMEKLKKL